MVLSECCLQAWGSAPVRLSPSPLVKNTFGVRHMAVASYNETFQFSHLDGRTIDLFTQPVARKEVSPQTHMLGLSELTCDSQSLSQ